MYTQLEMKRNILGGKYLKVHSTQTSRGLHGWKCTRGTREERVMTVLLVKKNLETAKISSTSKK